MGLKYNYILFLIFVLSSEGRTICAVDCGTVVQGHARSLILATTLYWLKIFRLTPDR